MQSFDLFQIMQASFPMPIDYTGVNMTIHAPYNGQVDFSYTTNAIGNAEVGLVNDTSHTDGSDGTLAITSSTTNGVTTITETPN